VTRERYKGLTTALAVLLGIALIAITVFASTMPYARWRFMCEHAGYEAITKRHGVMYCRRTAEVSTARTSAVYDDIPVWEILREVVKE